MRSSQPADVSNELQNVMLQHASIDTFVRHYSVGIHVDAQAIVRGMPAQKQLMRFACSMSRSIDPRRPYRLEDSSCINDVPRVRTLEDRRQARKQIRDAKKRTYEDAQAALQQEFGDNPPKSGPHSRIIRKRWKAQEKGVKKLRQKFDHADEQYDRAVKQVRNEKRWQKHRLIRENLERYKNEQPVIDSERQLSGKVVDEEVMEALQRTGYMTPQHMTLIDSVLTMPGTTVEKEYERRIAAINAVIAVCDAEEGAPSRPRAPQKRPADAVDIPPAAACLRDRSLPLRIRATILFLEPSLLFASNVQKRDQQYASFALVMLDCQKANALKCTRTPGPSADTSSTDISSRSQMTCTVSATFAGKS